MNEISIENAMELKFVMENLIATEIRRLVAQADVYVFALYDPRATEIGPIDFRCYQRENKSDKITIDVKFDFDGVGVWYICRRFGETFKVRHILAHIENGRFKSGKVAGFEGYWSEFPNFVAEDRWIQDYCRKSLMSAA